jgi:hypothetical protein
MSAGRQARTRTYVFEQGEPMTGEPAADRQDRAGPDINDTRAIFLGELGPARRLWRGMLPTGREVFV